MLDEIDKKIIGFLLSDAKMTYHEIGRRLSVSQGTVHVRVKKLFDNKVITGSTIQVDHDILELDIQAHIGLYTSSNAKMGDVIKELQKIPEIVEINFVTGSYSILLKLICSTRSRLKTILTENIRSIKGVERTETAISLEKYLERPISLA